MSHPKPTIQSLVVVVLIVVSVDLQTVASNDSHLISQIAKQQEKQNSRIEDLESSISLLMKGIEKFENLNRICRCPEAHPTNQKAHQASPREPQPPSSELYLAPGRPMRRRPARDAPLSIERQAHFLKGEPGKNGLDGVPGTDGAPGLDGVPGIDGRNGRDGANGRDGRDGKDGQPGERGPVGPPGPPGEPGKRGKAGAPGKTGAPGMPGVCAYKAKYDCDKVTDPNEGSSGATNNSTSALLLAPTMIGQAQQVSDGNDEGVSDERQVTVNEGDNIQLSCEAYGLPKPDYVWRKSNTSRSKQTILIDVTIDLQVTSYPGSQLPFYEVDRLQAGAYECIASNGVPPAAIKRVNLDVNYAPTVRLHPGPSIYQVKLGTSLLIECLVEANPAPLTYWMFGSELIMSIVPPSQVSSPHGELSLVADSSKLKKYTITESTGQLITGASYTTLTLSVADISSDDLGLYKCVSKNIVGQTVGYAWLESFDNGASLSSTASSSGSGNDRQFRDLILERGANYERLDNTVGWPNYLMERESANYSTFGNEKRRPLSVGAKKSLMRSNGSISQVMIESLIHNLNKIDPSGSTGPTERDKSRLKTVDNSENLHNTAGNQTKKHNENPVERIDSNNEIAPLNGGEEIGLCLIESDLMKGSDLGTRLASRISMHLLDQVGKPVYVGSVSWLNWWSLDSKLREENEINDIRSSTRFFATSPNKTDTLFEYRSLADLLKDHPITDSNSGRSLRGEYLLKHTFIGNSHLYYGGQFIYITSATSGDLDAQKSPRNLGELSIVFMDLESSDTRYLKLSNKILHGLDKQPFDLETEYKLNRIELASDENGVWIVIPTVEQMVSADLEVTAQDLKHGSISTQDSRGSVKRKIHVLKVDNRAFDSSETRVVETDYHVSMKIDWQMIGQLFIIDGVLYGIKDRNLYSSKLQFAYDLYRCKLLTTEYLNEPHRIFTNHFGNTQMIRYNPNDPKRLYTIDNGNLLWCPVKLIKFDPNDTWQPITNNTQT